MRIGRDHIVGAMRNHGLVLFLFMSLALFGVWSLPQLNKDEFPQFTIRQAVIAAIYPGATAQEIEAQVTIPLEEFINSYEEVDKDKTYSVTEDGVLYVYTLLRNEVKSMPNAWASMRAGLDLFRKTSLPKGVLDVVVIDDFGHTSSMLLAVESSERSSRELAFYARQLCDRLRTLPAVGKLRILGEQTEEIAITIDRTVYLLMVLTKRNCKQRCCCKASARLPAEIIVTDCRSLFLIRRNMRLPSRLSFPIL